MNVLLSNRTEHDITFECGVLIAKNIDMVLNRDIKNKLKNMNL